MAEIIRAVNHPHIVYVMDFNLLDDGQPYMVMELLEGETLKATIQRKKRLPRGDLVQIMQQAGSALQVLHGQQIVHRDLKPSNIFLLGSAGHGIHIKLIDFGISKPWVPTAPVGFFEGAADEGWSAAERILTTLGLARAPGPARASDHVQPLITQCLPVGSPARRQRVRGQEA